VAQARRNRRLIEHIDSATGARTYTDEATGEIVAQDQVVPEQTTIVRQPATEVSETTVTERMSPGQTYVTREPGVPVEEQVVTQRTVVSDTPVAPGAATQETDVVTEDVYASRKLAASRARQVIYLVFSILEALLAIRFVLMLLGANPSAGFAAMIYALTDPFLLPFAGLFGQPAAGGSVIETNTIVALIVYPLLAWLLAKIVSLVAGEDRTAVRTSRVDRRIER
jgi:YggT family protein